MTTKGRRSARDRRVIIAYLDDGPNLVGIAMNGWQEGHPSWWLNLQEHPWAVVRLPQQQPVGVRARAAVSHERERLWRRWTAIDPRLSAHAAVRLTDVPVIIFEPVEAVS